MINRVPARRTSVADRARWQWPAGLVVAAMLGVLALFHNTFWSIVLLWWRLPAFSYGFLILPIVAWLVWRQRRRLALLDPRPEVRVLGLILVIGCVWMLAYLLEIDMLEQLAVIGLLILPVWAILGTPVARVLSFPLGFLFLAVPLLPLHHALVVPMMNLTADVTVNLLQLTGVPVFQEGTVFSLATSRWEVVRGCAGFRYLMASATLGCLIAYVSFQGLRSRLLFVGFSIALPVVGNWLRVYAIVMIGHLSDSGLAVDLDHLIFGNVFFGLLVVIMIVAARIWGGVGDSPPEADIAPADGPRPEARDRRRLAGTALAALAAAAVWPASAFFVNQVDVVHERVKLSIPAGVAGWRRERERFWMWWPRVERVDGEFYAFYSKDAQQVSLYVGHFKAQRPGVELVDDERNVAVVRGYPTWVRKPRSHSRTVALDNRHLQVVQSTFSTPVTGEPGWRDLLIWHWYRLGDHYTDNPYLTKLQGIWSRLTGSRTDAALLVLATPYDEDPEAGAQVLRAFARDMLPQIEGLLDRSAGAR